MSVLVLVSVFVLPRFRQILELMLVSPSMQVFETMILVLKSNGEAQKKAVNEVVGFRNITL